MNARFKEHVMAHPDGRERTVRFGGFEFDREGREVRKDGARIRLGGQPLQVLGILLENHEQVVTREELRRRLWGSDTFVDFEQGLNTAIARLRQALGDSADRPRFIETVPGEGYRFVGVDEYDGAQDKRDKLLVRRVARLSKSTHDKWEALVPDVEQAERALGAGREDDKPLPQDVPK
jgi:DNA-binding winged helix-turn-helix (wHTH) protein